MVHDVKTEYHVYYCINPNATDGNSVVNTAEDENQPPNPKLNSKFWEYFNSIEDENLVESEEKTALGNPSLFSPVVASSPKISCKIENY